MKFFIDTANLAQIREANEMGVLDGVTTNPSLMAKENIRGEEAWRPCTRISWSNSRVRPTVFVP